MSGGGGSTSGAVEYPAYMKTWHNMALDGAGTDTLAVSLTDAMNYALNGASPYSGFVTVDIDDAMLGATASITSYAAPFTYLTTFGALNFDTLLTTYKGNSVLATYVAAKEARIAAVMVAESALLEDELTAVTLPAFKAGMRDINAVMSTAFVIGEANIRAGKVKALAKNDAIIRWEAEKLQADLAIRVDDNALRTTLAMFEVKKTIALTALEFSKAYITARVQGDDFLLDTRQKDKLWDVKVFQYGGNFLGSIAGSAVHTGDPQGNRMTGLIGGAAAGAGIGFMIGGPMGAAVGGGAGALLGAFG